MYDFNISWPYDLTAKIIHFCTTLLNQFWLEIHQYTLYNGLSKNNKNQDDTYLFADQYSNFSVSEVGVSLNGLNTQGENIADNGGIKQAFRAYTSWRDLNGKEDPLPSLPVIKHDQSQYNY